MTSEIRANTIKNRVGLGTVSYTNTGIVVSGIVTANSFSGPYNGTDIVGTGLTLTSTDTGSSAGPELKLFRNSASPADADYLGQLKFAGESDTGVERNYAKITGKILDASNGTEDGILEFAHIKGGSQTITGRWRSDSLQLLNGTNFSVAGTSTFTGDVDIAEKIVHTGDTDTYLQFTANTINLHSGGTTGLTVLDTSVRVPTKLGINGAAPQVPLDVTANGSGYAINVRGRSSDNVGEIRFTSNNYGSLYSVLQTGATYLNFQVGSTTNALRIADTGNVSIKTSSTTEGVLQVNGDVTAGYHHGGGMYGMLAKRKFQGGNALGGYGIRYGVGYESPWIVGYNAGSGYNNQITFGSMTTSDRSLETGVQKRMVIDMHSGNVGIGSETPGGVLDLYAATSNTILNVKSGDAGSVINLIDNATRSSIEQNGTSLKIISDTGGTYANSDIRLQVDGGTKMLIDSNGKIKLGSGGAVVGSANVEIRYDDPVLLIRDTAESSADGDAKIAFGNNSHYPTAYISHTWDGNDGSLTFHTRVGGNEAERLRVKSDGTVSYRTGGGKGFEFNSSGSSASVAANMYAPASYTLAFATNNLERLRIRSDGNIGIGNNVADANWKLKLVVPDNSSYQSAFNVTNNQNSDFNVVIKSNVSAIGNGTNNPLVFFTNGSSNERVRITSNGKVGINEDNPQAQLQVGGSICGGTSNQPFLRFFDSNTDQRSTKHYFKCVRGSTTIFDIITVDLNQNFHQALIILHYGARLQAIADSVTYPVYKIIGVNRFNGGSIQFTKNTIVQNANVANHGDIDAVAMSSTQYRIRLTYSGSTGGSSFCCGSVEIIGVGSGADGCFYSLSHSHGLLA